MRWVHVYIMKEDSRQLCPFCRTPGVTSQGEHIERLKKRAKGDDANAINQLGCCYNEALRGFPQNYEKAMELWLRAGELGCATAYNYIAVAYHDGEGVERDMRKAKYYYELGAMGGDAAARHNLGTVEAHAGNMNRAVKHWTISASAGRDGSLKRIRECFMEGYATRDDFEKALRAHKRSKDEMKSEQRELAAAALAAARHD